MLPREEIVTVVQINGMLTLTPPPPQVVALHHCLNVHGSLVLFISCGSFHTVHISTLLSEVQIHYFTSAVPFDTQTKHNKINAPVTPSPCPFPWSTTMWVHPTVALPADAPFKPNSNPPLCLGRAGNRPAHDLNDTPSFRSPVDRAF